MKRHIPELDGLRALAVLLVIAVHTGFVPGGYVGVDVFFVLSGYLITSILLRQRADGEWSIKSFYVRRARRLYPALLLMLVISLPFALLLAPTRHLYAEDVLVSGAYLSDIVQALHFSQLSGLSHTWSLAVEEQFYLVWPFVLLLLVGMRSHTRWTVLIAASLAAFGCLAVGGGAMMVLPIGRGIGLLFGAMLAFGLERREWPWNPTLTGVLSLAGLIAAIVLAASVPYGYASSSYLAACAAGVASVGLIGSLISGGVLARPFGARPVAWLGARSYGVYLWHFPLLYALEQLGPFQRPWALSSNHPQPLALLVALSGSVALAALSYRFVESRFLRSGRGVARQRSTVEYLHPGAAVGEAMIAATPDTTRL